MSTTLPYPPVPAYTTATSTSYACPSCYFGATAGSIHSFPYSILATITAIFTPYIITQPDGCVITSTCVNTVYPAGITSSSGIKVFSAPADMTWVASDVLMTYPTTYVEYLGFEKDSINTVGYATTTRGFCVGQSVTTSIDLPTPTVAASFIYPLQGTLASTMVNSTQYFSVAVPTPLMEYLEQAASGPSEASLGDIKTCSPLPVYFTNGRAPSSTCYTAYSIISPTSTAYTTSTSTCTDEEGVATVASPVITPAPEALTVVDCYFGVQHLVTTRNYTTTSTQEYAYKEINKTVPAIHVTESYTSFTDDRARTTGPTRLDFRKGSVVTVSAVPSLDV